MMTINVTCIVWGVLGFVCVVACVTKELVGAYRKARDAKRRYIND